MQPGGTFPEAAVAVLFLQNAGLRRHGKSMVLAITYGHLGIQETAPQVERLFGLAGSSGNQGVLFADDSRKIVYPHMCREKFDPYVAYRKAQKKLLRGQKGGPGRDRNGGMNG